MNKDFSASIHKELLNEKKSLIPKYGQIFVGKKGFFRMAVYELVNWFVTPMPGALGFFLRKVFYPLLFRKIGKGVVFGKNITIRHPHKIEIGARTFIDDFAVLDAKGESNEGIRIGENAYIGRNTILSCKEGSIHIGDFCNISANCTLLSETEIRLGPYCFLAGNCYLVAGGNHSFDDLSVPIMLQPSVSKGGIRIGEDVWLAAGIIVLDGVSIERSSVVGAGSVVTASIPEFSMARGARQMKIWNRRDQKP
ncbi:MAG TPA: acyltransferase [Candidatus Aminicenantes bacterium]|nr:acyltransferase [Candidatus Aminicenantes bacterium]